jgi:hypothetical protein
MLETTIRYDDDAAINLRDLNQDKQQGGGGVSRYGREAPPHSDIK